MRGGDERTGSLFSYGDLEARVPAKHPLRTMRELVNASLAALDGSFAALYAKTGRPSIAPERLLRAVLLQMLYSIRSERQLMERLEFDLLFRWFVGLGMDEAVWHASVFTHNRDRVLTTEIAQGLLSALLSQPAVKQLLSAEHFSVDGTMLKAFASMKSFRAKDGSDEPPEGGRNGERNFRNEKPSNETHASRTDPDARLYRKGKGQESRLAYLGHALMENRNGLAVAGTVTHASGRGEREAATELTAGLGEGASRAQAVDDHVRTGPGASGWPHARGRVRRRQRFAGPLRPWRAARARPTGQSHLPRHASRSRHSRGDSDPAPGGSEGTPRRPFGSCEHLPHRMDRS